MCTFYVKWERYKKGKEFAANPATEHKNTKNDKKRNIVFPTSEIKGEILSRGEIEIFEDTINEYLLSRSR